MTSGFVLDKGEEGERELGEEEAEEVLRGIHHEFVRVRKTDKLCSASKLFFSYPSSQDGGSIQYVHNWEPGDFIISDNLAVGHEAHPDTQRSREEVGLRVMHRVTVKGKMAPTK